MGFRHFVPALFFIIPLALASEDHLYQDEGPQTIISHPKPVSVRRTTNIGPMQREVTDHSIRILFQGDYPKKKTPSNHLVCSIQPEDESFEAKVSCWPMDPKCYHLHEVNFDQLLPDTTYVIEMGYLRGDEGLLPGPYDFSDAHEFKVRTAPHDYQGPVSFILFSCWRYFKRLGVSFCKEEGDRAWHHIDENINNHRKQNMDTHGILGAGDTMYADPFLALMRCQKEGDFVKSWMHSFKQEDLKNITLHIPLMTQEDDHNVSNDSASRETYGQSKRSLERFDGGIAATRLCALPHDLPEGQLWYSRVVYGQPLFFADLRRERKEGEIMGETQYKAMKKFIKKSNRDDRIPILVFSVPFSTQDGNDSCTDFTMWQHDLLCYLRDKALRVMIFSGDTHVGYTHFFQARGDGGQEIGAPIMEATVSGLHAKTRGKARTTKSIIDRSSNGLVMEAIGEKSAHIRADLYHQVLEEDLFARLTIDDKIFRITYYSTQDGHQLMRFTVDYKNNQTLWD